MDYGDDMLSPIENVDPNQLPSVLTESFKQSKITSIGACPKRIKSSAKKDVKRRPRRLSNL
jgi:hypothetical protein